jgi:hypothetical protein
MRGAGSGEARPHIPAAQQLRLAVFSGRRGHGVCRRDEDSQYSILNDAEPFGDKRCRRPCGPTKGVCVQCLLVAGERVSETGRHARKDCPFTATILDTAYRAVLQTTALNATEIARVTGLSIYQLTTEQGLALLTGHRAQDKMRSAAGGGKGAAAFAAWIACVQNAMVELGRHNEKCTDWGHMWFGTHRVYARALWAMRKHARNVYRKAERD